MIKNLNQVFENINNMYSNVHFDLEKERTTDKRICFTTTIVSHLFKGNVLVTGLIADTGVMNIYYTFHEVEENKELLDLINEFNANAVLAKGYVGSVDDKRHFEVRYCNCFELNDDQAPSLFKFFFDDLLSDNLAPYLAPIVELTK